MCNPATGCDDPSYECQILQPGRALCCPTVGEWRRASVVLRVVRPRVHLLAQRRLAARAQRWHGLRRGCVLRQQHAHCTKVGASNLSWTPCTLCRYYYDAQSRDCRTFTYNGCSGNHNRFLSISECRNYCQNPGNQGLPGGRLQDNPIGFPLGRAFRAAVLL